MSRLEWGRVMHELKRRRLTVLRTELVAPRMRRITLGGDDLEGFVTLAPGDHVKAFFPDPATGVVSAPEFVDGRLRMPEGAGEVISRDYTPLEFRPDAPGGPELDIDFVLHSDEFHSGPAASWAANARPGDELQVGGPRGSLTPPAEATAAILVADESALPAAARWLDTFSGHPVTALLSIEDPGTASYFDGRDTAGHELRWFSGEDREARIEDALRGLAIDETTLVFIAGEAGWLVPLRRYLRRELGLPKEQVDAHGYWKRGEVNLDHHAPLDPSDPD